MDNQKIIEVYTALKEKKFSVVYADENLKAQEEVIKTKTAEVKGFIDKEGKPDAKKVKFALFKKAIEKNQTQKDKLKEDHDTMEDYLSLIKSNKIPREDILTYTTREELKKSESSEFNALAKSKEGDLPPDVFAAVLEVIKEDIEVHKNKHTETTSKKVSGKLLEGIYDKIKEVKKIIKG